jgi:hypothetical protein
MGCQILTRIGGRIFRARVVPQAVATDGLELRELMMDKPRRMMMMMMMMMMMEANARVNLRERREFSHVSGDFLVRYMPPLFVAFFIALLLALPYSGLHSRYG